MRDHEGTKTGARLPGGRAPGRRRCDAVAACRTFGAMQRVLLVYPRFPNTYWGFQRALRIDQALAALQHEPDRGSESVGRPAFGVGVF